MELPEHPIGSPMNFGNVPPVGPPPMAPMGPLTPNLDDDSGDDDRPLKWDCSQIRRKITAFLKKGTMTQTAWLQQLGVNSNSFQRFMKLKGPHSTGNSTYYAAHRFFEDLEKEQKSKSASLKRKEREESKVQKEKKHKKADELAAALGAVDYSDTRVFDDCNEIRRKIKHFLQTEAIMTQSAFLKLLGGINGNSYSSFMRLGPLPQSGASNVLYPAAYHFFEKRRILENKPKSATRLENEAKYPDGMPLKHDDGRRWVFVGSPN
eukprot:TRINITY_DN22788_c0_g1_i1.p1 TRINITY_DN22788_c0_g1~~TRINITY_DN22788_c0_g1_i1.p1  ORF type:complete len:264 (-),score=81.55 TRINITY_DN22788_c0_g1_i1:245-1036(-)